MVRALALAIVLALSSLIAPAPPGGADAGASAEPQARIGSYQQMTRGYSCKRSGARQGLSLHKCANVKWRRANIEMNGPLSVRVINRTRRVQQATCSWEETKTWTFTASVSSEIEAGVIFARAKVQISASVSRAKAVKVGTSVNISVSPRSTAWCRSGMSRPRFGGKMRTLECAQSGGCRWGSTRDYSAKVPKQFVWEIRERRN